LFISNLVNEPLPTTAAIATNNSASHEYQKFISMNGQNRMNAAKQMSQREKNMVMIGAGQINHKTQSHHTQPKSNNNRRIIQNKNRFFHQSW
jgi:hypothetical protein